MHLRSVAKPCGGGARRIGWLIELMHCLLNYDFRYAYIEADGYRVSDTIKEHV